MLSNPTSATTMRVEEYDADEVVVFQGEIGVWEEVQADCVCVVYRCVLVC